VASGVIELDPHKMSMIVATNPKLTLHLEDGARWDCWMQNDSGRLINRGKGIYL
jgi:hypothetical protein